MANIDSKFQSSALHRHLRVALVGMGGVGYVDAKSFPSLEISI